MKNTNDVINSVKRLQRYGDENSRTTKKLREAAYTVAEFIIQQVGRTGVLPRGYAVLLTTDGQKILVAPSFRKENQESFTILDETLFYGKGFFCHYTNPNVIIKYHRPSKQTLLKFSEDISTGLLDEIADQVAKEAAEFNSAIKEIETVKF